MSSKNGTESRDTFPGRSAGKRASVVTRLTLWYTLLSVALIAAIGSAMYWALAERLRQQDDQFLAGRIAELRAVLLLHAPGSPALREEVQREAASIQQIRIRILDSVGEVVIEAPAADTAVFGRRLLPLEEDRGTDWRSSDGGVYRVMSARVAVGAGFTVQVAISRSKEEKLLSAYGQILLAAICAAVTIAIAGGYFIARDEMRAVSRLAALVAELNATDLHRRVDDDSWPRELKPLASNFDQLLARLEDAFARMSQFSADIAHELRTPLHILQGEAEMALTRGGSSAAYRACIESAAEEYQRLANMVDALLFLARAEQPEERLDKKSLVLEQEITAVCDFYQAMADEQAVSLTIQGAGEVLADAALLRRALGNLIANALRHTSCGGKIVVKAKETKNHTVEIAVCDSGSGIAPVDLTHVFDRFYRADGTRSRKGAGTGLGLAIVKFIMQLHGGTATIESKIHHGTTVTLNFPALPTPS